MDRSDAADARRFRWLLNGRGYYLEEAGLCGYDVTSTPADQDEARALIDREMEEEDGPASQVHESS